VTEVHVAAFDELDSQLAYSLWALRESVFVVEQECAYQELDGRDTQPETQHLWITAEDRPVAYLRILEETTGPRIGRVVVAAPYRGRGLADLLMRTALDLIGDRPAELHAQSHLEQWYERFGFSRSGEDYLDDEIPHTPMRRP
jgi:ElaA protein